MFLESELEDKSFIRDNLQPVFLGNTKRARQIARDLYKKYGIVSYIADKKRSPFSDLQFKYTVFKVSGTAHGELVSDELLYLFSFDPACTYVTVPMTEEYSRFLAEYRDKLSAACVIREADNIFSDLPFINNEDGGQNK